eukprot:8538190-Alexandrium_andersonii.AAC.1
MPPDGTSRTGRGRCSGAAQKADPAGRSVARRTGPQGGTPLGTPWGRCGCSSRPRTLDGPSTAPGLAIRPP